MKAAINLRSCATPARLPCAPIAIFSWELNIYSKEMIRTISISATLFLFSLAVLAQTPRLAPELRLKTIDGRVLHLQDYKGKVVLLNFWATWCPPCRQEIPELIKIQRQYRSRGLQIVGATYPPENSFAVRRFARRARVNYPVVSGTKETKRMFSDTETLPITAVIDSESKLWAVVDGTLCRRA